MRFPPIKPADMTPEQRELAASYRTGWRTSIANPDGSLGGPFDATLRSPGLAGRLAGVSNYFRDGTALPRRLNEFAILVGVLSRNRRNFRHPSSSPATSASRSIILPSLWKV